MATFEMLPDLLLATTLVLTALALLLFGSWYRDRKQLRRIAESIVDMHTDNQEKVVTANHWVYRNQGFAKNRHYFLHPKLGPTPRHVLEYGGDCSDKSRLLLAFLREIGIRGTAVMLYDQPNGDATHTVVEARFADSAMAADPVFDIVFPNRSGGYYGIRELREDQDLLTSRLNTLIEQRGPDAKVAFYKRETESYQWPKTINWDKNGGTRLIGEGLRLFFERPELIARPMWLEDPKQLVSTLSGLAALGFFLVWSFFIVSVSR